MDSENRSVERHSLRDKYGTVVYFLGKVIHCHVMKTPLSGTAQSPEAPDRSYPDNTYIRRALDPRASPRCPVIKHRFRFVSCFGYWLCSAIIHQFPKLLNTFSPCECFYNPSECGHNDRWLICICVDLDRFLIVGCRAQLIGVVSQSASRWAGEKPSFRCFGVASGSKSTFLQRLD